MDPNVTALLDNLNHPMHTQINELRTLILSSRSGITEGIKWNGPNYKVNESDRMTIKVNPPKKVHLILHTGARSKTAFKDGMEHLYDDLLTWKDEDRAVIEFTDAADFNQKKAFLPAIIAKWLELTS